MWPWIITGSLFVGWLFLTVLIIDRFLKLIFGKDYSDRW